MFIWRFTFSYFVVAVPCKDIYLCSLQFKQICLLYHTTLAQFIHLLNRLKIFTIGYTVSCKELG